MDRRNFLTLLLAIPAIPGLAFATVLELKLVWVKTTGRETVVRYSLNVCTRVTRDEREVLRRDSRRFFEQAITGTKTSTECVDALIAGLRQRATEEGHEVYQ